ncbi:MAG: hypothetical protein R3F11_11810 [Verrucomicrobiales bacterium]
MEAILAEEPDYYFASKSLVDWYFEANEFEKAEGESLRLIRLAAGCHRPWRACLCAAPARRQGRRRRPSRARA